MGDVVESWWNGDTRAVASQRVRVLCRNGSWSVEHIGPWRNYSLVPCPDQHHANDTAERVRTTAGGTWHRIDDPTR